MIRLGIIGATGKTGRAVLELACRTSGVQVVAALTGDTDPWLRQTVRVGSQSITFTAETSEPLDVLIDFSTPTAAIQWARRAFERKIAFVSGTTGLTDEQRLVLQLAADQVPVLWAPNFSVGINLLQRVAGAIAQQLGESFDVEIIEAHHNQKTDAPSGTALSLAEAVATATGRDLDASLAHGRSGPVGARPPGQIGIHAVRLGDEIGWHEIHFGGPGETLVLRHAVRSREPFARGALTAARWIVNQKPGLYSLQDALTSA